MQNDEKARPKVSRRQVMRVLAASAITGSAAASALQQPSGITFESLREAATLSGHPFEEDRLRELVPAVDRALGELRALRDLEISDEVEPAIVFQARR